MRSYFERPLPIALIFGSFFAIFLPLAALQFVRPAPSWLPYLLAAQAVGLGTTHFFITLAVYLQSSNLRYFASTTKNRIVYFALPLCIFLFFAWSEAAQLRKTDPLLAGVVFGTLRFLDFFHVGRQSMGMLQIWKRAMPELPAWSRRAENAFFVGMAGMQWQTFLMGGRFPADRLIAIVPAIVLCALFAMIAGEHALRALRAGPRAGRFRPLTYLTMQALCAASAVYDTRLYLVALTLHYVEYHVIMMPRWLWAPLAGTGFMDRLTARLRRPPLLFYGVLAAVVVLFEQRTSVPAGIRPTTAFFVHLFDGIFVVHYVLEAFLWKFNNPHYRATLAPLYFAPWPAGSAAAPEAPAAASGAAEAQAATPAPQPAPDAPPADAQPADAQPAEAQPSAQSRSGALIAVCAALFASGASALVFETLWFHQAGLAFGNGVWASSLVLSAFMAGMGLGNWIAARRGDRLRNALAAYARLEAAIAVTGVALVYLLPRLGVWLAAPARALADAPALLDGARFVLAFVLLLVPAVAMGMTLPLLVRAACAWESRFLRVLGLLYGANTAGAVAGVLGAELALLPALGIRGSAWAAGACNACVALLSWLLARRAEVRPAASSPEEPAQAGAQPSAEPGWPWLWGAFGAGFALLALEVVWLRFAMLFINDTPLSFALILAAVLSGIAAGGFAASLWAGAAREVARFAPAAAACAGLLAFGSYALHGSVLARFYVPDQDASAVLEMIAPLVFPASFASGVLFALTGDGLRRATPGDARAAGRLAFANTLGAGLGSLVAGFVLLPYAGMERSFFALFALYGLIAAVLAVPRGAHPSLRFGGAVVLGAALAFFPFGRMRAVFIEASAGRWMTSGDRIAAVREGLTGTLVHVVHGVRGLALFDQLATNAYSMSVNDFAARRYMKQFVLLPRAVHPRLRHALVIGYGVGNTAAALVQAPEVARIDVVDVSRDILALARQMRTAGDQPLDDPRVHVHIEDGRFFLQTTAQRYDLITGEPPPPVMAGVANLYSREYFALVRDRLREGGIATYWLPVMNISAGTTKALIRAFCDAFEDCSLWHGSARNFMLMGTRGAGAEGPVDVRHFARAWEDDAARRELVAIGFELPPQLGAAFIGGADYLGALTADAEPLSDDWPSRMQVPGTREERDALVWQFRDTAAARARFADSELVRRLFPPAAREAALRQFENQRLLNDLLFPGQTQARQTVVLHQVLHGTPLRLPPLLLLGSNPDVQRALERAAPHERDSPDFRMHLAAGALADRDFVRARDLLAGVPDAELPMPDLRKYVDYVIERGPSR